MKARLKPIGLGLLGIALGFLLYQFVLDYWFLHQARIQADEQRAVQAAIAKIQNDQAKSGASK